MGKKVVVIEFDEPYDFDEIGLQVRDVFLDKNDIKVHLAMNDPAEQVLSVFDPKEQN